VTAALGAGADAVHPGYGFLSESPDMAEACEAAGLIFVGPTAAHMRQMGNKIQARLLARDAGVPTLAGSEKIASAEQAATVAGQVGYPVILKAAAGGGGRGMKVVEGEADLRDAFVAAAAEAGSAFGDPTLHIERFIRNARHIEVHLLGDARASAAFLQCDRPPFDRPGVDAADADRGLLLRHSLRAAAVR
jgi:acetyl-CoA carboxylase biotin carboxylase subunit